MSDWLKVEFYAQVPDGMEISVDDGQVSSTLARTFGFSRVRDVAVQQVSDETQIRRLINDRPSEGTPIWPSR